MFASVVGLGRRIFLVQLDAVVLWDNEDEGGCAPEFLRSRGAVPHPCCCSGANGASAFHVASSIGVPCWMGLCNEQ